MLITKEVEIRLNGRNIKCLENFGYNIPYKIDKKGKKVVDISKTIFIKVEHLAHGSEVEIEVQCDYCGKTVPRIYRDYYARKIAKNSTPNKKDSCYDCRAEKKKESDILIHGVKHTTQLDSTKQKMKETNLNKYGVEHFTQTNEFKEKTKQTCLEKYGVENPSQSDIVKSKFKQTCFDKYGVEHYMQVDSIKQKTRNTLFENGTAPKSNQQLYINNLLNGIINYPIKNYSLDIAFPKEKIYIEYDGSGHDLSVIMGSITEDDFRKKEIKRRYSLKKDGWKEIRIISKKDKLPNDELLLFLINLAKNYFKSGHSWMCFDIDNSTIISSIYNCNINYGKLKKITKNDINFLGDELKSSPFLI